MVLLYTGLHTFFFSFFFLGSWHMISLVSLKKKMIIFNQQKVVIFLYFKRINT